MVNQYNNDELADLAYKATIPELGVTYREHYCNHGDNGRMHGCYVNEKRNVDGLIEITKTNYDSFRNELGSTVMDVLDIKDVKLK